MTGFKNENGDIEYSIGVYYVSKSNLGIGQKVDDYTDLTLPPKEERAIGVLGQRRLRYLKQHNKILYYNLLTFGKLRSHLADIEEEAQTLFLRLVKQYAEREGVTERIKAERPMEWVRRLNNIYERTQEFIQQEIICT